VLTEGTGHDWFKLSDRDRVIPGFEISRRLKLPENQYPEAALTRSLSGESNELLAIPIARVLGGAFHVLDLPSVAGMTSEEITARLQQ